MFLNIVLGTGLVIIMALLARTNLVWLNGLIPLFPTFALIGQLAAYTEKGAESVKNIALIGLFSLVPYAAYLLCVYFLTDSMGLPKAAVIGVLAWFVLAGVLVFFKYTS